MWCLRTGRGGLFTLGLLLGMSAQAVTVEGLRLWPAPDHTRLVFDLDGPVQHSLFTLADPQRVVIDLNAADITAALPTLSKSSEAVVKDIRYAKRGQTDLRVVLDLSRPVKAKSFSLKPQGEYGYRLVLDLEYDTGPAAPIKSPPKELPMAPHPRDVVIAIDAGHGGDDSGALGRKGTREKDVVLKIAKYLETLVNQQPGMKAVMIRQGDYFISLHQRVEKAREAQADLFVSIHADAFNDRRAKGSSVFVLSEHGASSQVARFLADSENNSDLVGGVSLDDKDDLLKRVLVDMVRNSTIEDSHNIAKYLLKGLRQVNSLHKGRVEQAGFRVLKAPDIPSVLIETAFISNPSEEAKLRNAAHQEGFAKAIFKGIVTYFKQNPPPDTRMAELWQKKQRLAIRDNPSRS